MDFNRIAFTDRTFTNYITEEHIGKLIYSERFSRADHRRNSVGCRVVFKVVRMINSKKFEVEPFLEDEEKLDTFILREGVDIWQRDYENWMEIEAKEILFEL